MISCRKTMKRRWRKKNEGWTMQLHKMDFDFQLKEEGKTNAVGLKKAKKQSKRSEQKIIFPYYSAQNQSTEQLC